MGITEFDFWNMTLAELERALQSKKRVKRTEAQERAGFDYILAELIGKSISRIYSSSNTMPEIETVYSSLFDEEEVKAQKANKKAELSVIRFKQFANSFNQRFTGGAKSE